MTPFTPEHLDAYPHIGAYLKQLRINAGTSLVEVADCTRLHLEHIRAIEEGRINDLPGKAYARGYIHTYAAFLGLDADIVLDYYAKQRDLQRRFAFYNPQHVETAEKPTHNAMMMASAMIAAVILAWGINAQRVGSVPNIVQPYNEEWFIADMSVSAQPIDLPKDHLCRMQNSNVVRYPCYWKNIDDAQMSIMYDELLAIGR